MDSGESEPQDFTGLGPFLEDEPDQVFRAVHNMVLRQEILAKNRLAQDDYWTQVKQGFGDYYRLEKLPDQDRWKCVVAPGTSSISLAPVPNKAADLCNKVVEAIMVDPPKPSPKAENDAEDSERAAEMAEEFLSQDGGEQGTRDDRLFWSSLDAATSKSAAFHHYWVDAQGGGSVPLQIKAHPQAQDANNPLVGPDGMPTTDYILRYVTEDGQFTQDASQAKPQWLPKICIDQWGREHIRTYPETADVHDAEKVIGLYYCTLGQAKRRWPDSVGQLEDDQLGQLCDWTPPRYLKLLPPALRARWKQATGDATDPKGSANDERTMFYYVAYVRPVPLYPKGATVFCSGADGGTILGKDTLTADVPDPKSEGSKAMRCLDLPIVQIDLIQDADDKEPLGKPLIGRFGGAGQALSTLGRAFLEAIDIILHPATYTPVTSPVTGDDVQHSRATGEHIQVLSREDYPHYEDQRQLPTNYLQVTEWLTEDMHSASGVSKASSGNDKQQEVSGVARNIAVKQANVALSRFQQSVLASYERHYRIKCQLAMKSFTVPQQLMYEGEDGAYKQEWWTGVDFAKVTDISIASGTGTMMAPQDKVAYVQQLSSTGMMTPAQAAKAARPAFADALGLPDDPHQQRVERQVGSWLKGPPDDQWVPHFQAYEAEQQQIAAVVQQQQVEQQAAVADDGHQRGLQGLPEAPQPQAVQPPQPTIPAPWTPFGPLPMDDEPMIAALRQERLSDLMATVRYSAQPPEWQQMVVIEYTRMRQAVSAAQRPPDLPKGVTVQAKTTAADVGTAEQNAMHPKPAQPAAPPAAPIHVHVGKDGAHDPTRPRERHVTITKPDGTQHHAHIVEPPSHVEAA